MKSNQQSDKPLNYSGFRSNSMKQSSFQMNQTQHSSCFSQPQSEYDQQVFGLEEDCLLKLMEQRKKIQELTYVYQKTVDQLKKEEQKVKKLETQQGNYEELKTIKLRFLSLSKQFEQVMGEKTIVQNQNQKLKQNLTNLSKEHQKLLKLTQLKQMRKQQETNTEVNRYQELLKNKDDQIRRNINIYEAKQKQYQEQIHTLNNIIGELKKNINDIKRNNDSDITHLTSQLLKRDTTIQKLKKAIDNVKEENSTLRKQVKELDDQFMAKELQWLQAQDELIFEINNVKRKLNDSQTRYNDSKYECQKLQDKNVHSLQTISNLRQELKSLQEQSTISFDQLTHLYEQKISNYKHQIQELKESVQQLLEVKDMFNKENDMLKDKISKDNDQKRKRNLMMRSELREIQKMENSVKRVL